MIFLILGLGLILRLISLNQSLWLDEATTAYVARNFSFGEIITKFAPGDFHPPLYYLVIRVWSLVFGTSEIALRMPSVIFGVLTIWIVNKISKSKTAALLLATSGLLVYYSQEARMYSLIALLVSCLVYWFIKRRWFLFSVALLLIGATDYPALLILPVFWVLAKKDWKKLAISHLPLAISYIFWLPVLLQQFSVGFSAGQSVWGNLLGTLSFKNFALIPVKFIFGRISFDNKYLYVFVVILVVFLFGYLILKSTRRVDSLIWLWLVLPILLGLVVSLRLPIFSYFRFLFVLPAFYILVAKGIEETGKYKKIFLCLVLSINVLCTMYYVLIPKFHREDWRSLAEALGSVQIVFPANSQKEALVYYGKGDQIINSDQIEKEDKEVWLSRYVWEIFDPSDTARQKIESLGYNKTNEYNFNGVVVWKYNK